MAYSKTVPGGEAPLEYGNVAAVYLATLREDPFGRLLHHQAENILIPIFIAAQTNKAQTREILGLLETSIGDTTDWKKATHRASVWLNHYQKHIGRNLWMPSEDAPPVAVRLPQASDMTGWQHLCECAAKQAALHRRNEPVTPTQLQLWVRKTAEGVVGGQLKHSFKSFDPVIFAASAPVQQKPLPMRGVALDI